MSDPVTNVEIEDVLASIRRLVSVEDREAVARLTPVDDALVLTPAQMVAEPAAPEEPRDAEADAPDDAPFPLTFEHHADAGENVVEDVSQKEDDTSEIDSEEAAIRARVAELEAVIAAQQDSGDWEPEDGAGDMSPGASVEVLHWEDHVADARTEARESADDVVLEAEPDLDDEEPRDWAPEPEHGPAKVVTLEDVVADAVMQELARGEGDAADVSDPTAAYDGQVAAFEEAAGDETYAAPEAETHEAYGTDDWSDHAASAHAEEDYLTEGEPHGWEDASHDEGRNEAHAPVAGGQAEDAYEDDTYADEADHAVGADAELSSAARDEATPDYAAPDDMLLDEETLREMVTDIVRQELQGALGERITRNVRKLVRREIHRALAAQELE